MKRVSCKVSLKMKMQPGKSQRKARDKCVNCESAMALPAEEPAEGSGSSRGGLVRVLEYSFLQLSFRLSLCEGQLSCAQSLEKNLRYGNFFNTFLTWLWLMFSLSSFDYVHG